VGNPATWECGRRLNHALFPGRPSCPTIAPRRSPVRVRLSSTALNVSPIVSNSGNIELLQQALDETAQLAQRIYPSLLDARGLAAALRAAAASASVSVSVDVALPGTYPTELAASIYLCWLDALEHAGTDAEATISVRDEERVEFAISHEPDATWQLGTEVLQGRQQIRDFVVHGFPAFKPAHHWLSDTPAYKIRITADGDKGTLYFECHVVDVKTRELVAVVGGDLTVEKINGHWLIRKHVQSPVVLGT
jgi:hypothetical protein